MLAVFRRGLNTWPARLFFLILVFSFAAWGVGDVVRRIGAGDTSVATVGGQTIDLPAAQDAFRRQLQQVRQMMGNQGDVTPEIRRMVALQAVDQLINQAAIDAKVGELGLAVPQDAINQAVWDEKAFQGPDGKFDRATYVNRLRTANLSEQRYVQEIRSLLGQRQLLEAVRAGATSPDVLSKQVFALQMQKRVADVVEIPFAAAPTPPGATEAQLNRWYDNHPELYSAPEYRRIKAVVLSPLTVAKDIAVGDDEIKAAYDQHHAEFNVPEKRSVEVILASDEAQAQALATTWISGADWASMQKEAQKVGATATDLTDATLAEFPSPELGKAVFEAPADTVMPPVHGPLGWHVFQVSKITPGNIKTLDEARDTLRQRVAADKAADLIYDRAGKVEDLLTGGAKLEELPGDLGLAAVTGTLDAKGLTPDGLPAPIPGDAALRDALVKAAFEAKPGDPPKLIQAQGAAGSSSQSYFAVSVEDIKPPAPKPYDSVAAAVAGDWTRDQIRHEQETVAARLLAAVKGGQSLADAAKAAGLTERTLPPSGREAPSEGMPAQLLSPLFALKKGQPTMVETPTGFVVAVLADIQEPDPAADPIGFGRLKDSLARAIGNDTQEVFATAVRARANPRVNNTLLDSIAQPTE